MRTKGIHPRLRAGLTLVVAGIAATFLVSATAQASPGAPAQVPLAEALYSADADASLIETQVLATPDLALLDGDITNSEAHVTTFGSPYSSALADNLDLEVGGDPSLNDILVRAAQTAPPDPNECEGVSVEQQEDGTCFAQLAEVPADPLLNLDLSVARARARDYSTGVACPEPDQPISFGRQEIAGLEVIVDQLPEGADLLLTGQGVSFTESATYLPSIEGPGDLRGVQATATTVAAPIEIAGAIRIEVVGTQDPAMLTALATGDPATALVNYDAPALKVTDIATNEILGVIDLVDDLGSLLIPIEIPDVLSIEVALGEILSQEISPDGTHVSAAANLARVTINLANMVDVLNLEIGPMSVDAVSPVGGVRCPPEPPIRITKTASSEFVAPGEDFAYTITVTNADEACTLQNLRVEDVITYTGSGTPSVTGTNPQADTIDGLTVVWNNVGPLAPGESRQLNITVRVPTEAQNDDFFDDTATATGDCDGVPDTETVTVLKIPTVGRLPRTGGDATLPLIGAGVAALAALALRRLRRA